MYADTQDPILVTPIEAARILGVSAMYVTQLSRVGVLAIAERTDGGHRRYRRADVEALAIQRAQRKAAEAAEELAALELRIGHTVAA